MAVPQAMSYALVAGMPGAIYGLYNAFMGLIPYPFFGTSPHLITGPTAVMSILVKSSIPSHLGALGEVAPGTQDWVTVAVTLSFIAGVFQVILGLFRLGFLVELVSEPVIIGFTSGSAFLIASTQFTNFLGVPKCKESPCHFHESIINVFEHTGQFHGPTILVGSLSLFFLLFMKIPGKKYLRKTRFNLLPSFAPLILLVLSISIIHFADPSGSWGIKTVGKICDSKFGPGCLPNPKSPLANWFFRDLVSLIPSALAVSFIGYMESMTVAKTCARQQRGTGSTGGSGTGHPSTDVRDARAGEGGARNIQGALLEGGVDEEGGGAEREFMKIDPSQELIALGICNLFCSFFQGYPVTGSFSRTAVNASAGATSPLASLIAGVVVATALLLATSVLQFTPKVTLASIVLSAITNLIEPREVILLWKVCRTDFWACIVVFLCTLFLGVEAALAIGIVCNWAISLSKTNSTTAAIIGRRQGEGKGSPGSVNHSVGSIVDLGAGLFYGESYDRTVVMKLHSDLTFSSAPRFQRQVESIAEKSRPTNIIVDCTNVNSIDITGIRSLILISTDLQASGTLLCLAALSPSNLEILHRAQQHFSELRGSSRWVFYCEGNDEDEDSNQRVVGWDEVNDQKVGKKGPLSAPSLANPSHELDDPNIAMCVFKTTHAAIEAAKSRRDKSCNAHLLPSSMLNVEGDVEGKGKLESKELGSSNNGAWPKSPEGETAGRVTSDPVGPRVLRKRQNNNGLHNVTRALSDNKGNSSEDLSSSGLILIRAPKKYLRPSIRSLNGAAGTREGISNHPSVGSSLNGHSTQSCAEVLKSEDN
eukprot:CAMPEP_0184501366 /NCGR_PEP_ID=MMETSP0113_2-20130426/47461_1 /TAXON_ID=91329 /ORGANISM="Norrisiella sphaerica, Strain BC52" /LENGTH=819 /DNA_ID=CAMNT_0026890105 /DNA_START=374 /DNA_END=2833 /DNA_ORIENTATION=-